MEIIGDILRVIQDGATRPTQIMHAANLTWPPLMAHLEVLLRNQLLSRELDGNRATYTLTEKGSAILNMYTRLKEETGVLEIEAAAEGRLGDLTEPPTRAGGRKMLSNLKASLLAASFRVIENRAVGSSGTEYTFPLVVEGMGRSRHAFIVLDEVDESAVIRAFVKRLDTELDLRILYVKGASEGAKRVAALDSIPMLSAGSLAGFGESLAFLDAFRSAGSLLLEVDPSENYERVVQELVRREAEASAVTVFTWTGSRVYPALPRSERVKVHVMTSATAATQARRKGETAVAPHTQSEVLGLMEGSFTQGPGAGGLLVFDSLSELMVSLGDEKALLFLRKALQLLGRASGQRSVFILKRGFHDERTAGLVRSLLPGQLTYDRSGLRMSVSA